jgi:hypothetical protein
MVTQALVIFPVIRHGSHMDHTADGIRQQVEYDRRWSAHTPTHIPSDEGGESSGADAKWLGLTGTVQRFSR